VSWLARRDGVERDLGDGWHAELSDTRAGPRARLRHDDGRFVEQVFARTEAPARWLHSTHERIAQGDPETLALVVQGLPRIAPVPWPTCRTHCWTPVKHLPGAKVPSCAPLTRCNAGAGRACAPA